MEPMAKHIFAVAGIFLATALAWVFLAATIQSRTEAGRRELRGRVESVWGAKQNQRQPDFVYEFELSKDIKVCRRQPVSSTRLDVNLALDYRQKGLLWFSTYSVDLTGDYTLQTDEKTAVEGEFVLPLPAAGAVYDGLQVSVDGLRADSAIREGAVKTKLRLEPGRPVRVKVGYRSQGLERWEYRFAEATGQARDFLCRVRTNFREVDFPDNSLAPTVKKEEGAGWLLEWKYQHLVSGVPISVVMPEKAQPGPLAGEISAFAPVSLFFFFFLMLIITAMKRIELHPLNYFFLACSFFAFHLLLAYLVDHISIHWAFVICSVVSVGLVVSYLRIVAGVRFALVEAGLSQVAYLVLFSYAFFFPGYTGLAVTVGAIVTLFVVMQWTAGIRWTERLRRPDYSGLSPETSNVSK